jgi:nitrate/TMAO reductase-like tetraheme cytochrome c subunit
MKFEEIMKRLISALKRFFLPPEGTPLWIRLLPYAVLGVLTLVVLISSAYAWEYTNSPEFCGTACHTMPPEYTAYLTSPHARVDCVDCHIGEGFITTRITRKAGDAKHIIRLAFKDYEFPITAEEMRPARETCELCHFPEKFSDDSLREIKHFGNDTHNTPSSTYLVMKTGGGTKRVGLGQGIHWHIENPVYYYATDHAETDIPYVQVVADDGSVTEYVDIESDFDPAQIAEEDLYEMDCITCHNRITHLVRAPEEILDQLMDRGIVSPDIPDIRRQAVEIFYRPHETQEIAISAIAGLEGYYEHYYPDFYAENTELVQDTIVALQDAYAQSVYPEQKSDWDSHPNHVGHIYSPGCFRCHDGKHLNEEQEAIRLECNVCHSIPVVAGESDFVANIAVSRGPEPESHFNTNWISMHRDVFDQTCENCHTTEDPGGTSNTTFCSNSACHGSVYEYAGFDAPALRAILQEQLPEPAPPVEEMEVSEDEPLTYSNIIGPLLIQRCGNCHGANAMVGLDLTSYETTMLGGDNGLVIVPGDPEASRLVQIQIGDQPHFSRFTPDELELVIQWIAAGAPEN